MSESSLCSLPLISPKKYMLREKVRSRLANSCLETKKEWNSLKSSSRNAYFSKPKVHSATFWGKWGHHSSQTRFLVNVLFTWGWSKAARNVGRPDGAINDTFMASKSAQRLSNSWIPQFDSLIPWARHHKLFTSGLAPINTVHLLSVLLEDLQWPCGPGGIPEL